MDVATHPDIVIDTRTPHFSWRIADEYDDQEQLIRGVKQTGHRIRVHAVANGEVMWDCDQVHSASSTHIHYGGSAIRSDTRYAVSIKYYSASGESQWYVAHFRTALFSHLDWSGQWIGSEGINMNQLRTVVNIKSQTIAAASVFISGIGYYQLYIEGQLIDPSRRLDVGWTTYQQRTLYASYDVSAMLKTGGPLGIGIMLGQGWYNKQQWAIGLGARIELAEQYGPPRVLMQLNINYTDGTSQSIVTDASWLGREGEHRYDSVYMGTTMDLRAVRSCWSCANFTDPYPVWINAAILPSPVNFTAGGQLSLQSMDPIRIGPQALHVATSGHRGLLEGGVLKPISKDTLNGQVFDLGQNFAGWCKISSLNAAKSTIIQLRYAELRYSRGENGINFRGLYYENLQSIAVMDTVILNGTGNETFEPLFTYHGFRYLLVNGYDNVDLDDVECYNAHSETTLIGNFSSSSPILNQIQHNILWSQLSNSMSLPTDCPQRNERRGWMGDAALSIDEVLYNFDYVNFYLNFLTLIADNQSPDGAVSDTVPFAVGTSPADPNWGTAYATITWYLYEHTGDLSIVEKYYDGIEAWISCLRNQHAKTGLANLYYNYGDWAAVQQTKNSSLVSSYAFLHDISTFVNMSTVLNRTDNVQKYAQIYQQLAEEFHQTFYNPSISGYTDGSQTANILALALPNVVPAALRSAVLESLVNDLRSTGHFTGGIVSVAALYPLLSNEGHQDLALQLALSTSFPSYGYMFNNNIQNATTTWEQWNTLPTQADSSLNHHMFNSIGGWFYRYLAGIQLNALKTITVHPRISFEMNLLDHVEAEVVTIKGRVQVEWTRLSVDSLMLSVHVPNNADAIVVFDPLIRNSRCLKLVCDDALACDWAEDPVTGSVSVQIASGTYRFTVYWQ